MTSLGHEPNEHWSFDDSVSNCFEDMLERSIPKYLAMRESVSDVGRFFMRHNSVVVDLGCSHGDTIAGLLPYAKGNARFIGYENSTPMLEYAVERFKHDANVAIFKHDLSTGLRFGGGMNLITSVLTLQFLSPIVRELIVEQAYSSLFAGGALIVVEKVVGDTYNINKMMTDRYHLMKEENGYSKAEIKAKSESLKFTMNPYSAAQNEHMLRRVGFKVDCFWRWMNFAAWVAVK